MAPSSGTTGATPEPTATTPPSTAQQLVTVLAPLRSSPGGVHELTLALEPEGLGTVKATMTVGSQEIRVRLSADSESARQALRETLPQLHQELSRGGTRAMVWLKDDKSNHGGEGEADRSQSEGAEPDEADAQDLGTAIGRNSSRLVDLRL